MNKENFDTTETRFDFTKSPADGRFHMKNKKYPIHNHLNGLPDDIGKEFGELLTESLKAMASNGARKITVICKWE